MNQFTLNSIKWASLFLFTLIFTPSLQAEDDLCALTLHAGINISLDGDCQAEITPDMVLVAATGCTPDGPDAWMIVLMDENEVMLPTSPFVTIDHAGQTITVKLLHLPSGQQGWSYAWIEDGLDPFVVCPDDITVGCDAPTDPSATGSPVVSDCSPTTVTYTDVINNNGCGQNAITRTWLIQGENGYSTTCTQIISTESPDISEVVFPSHLNDIDLPALECNSSPDTSPSNTGQPTLNGQPLSNGGACALMETYEDLIFPLCGNSYKIIRTWTVMDWCTNQSINYPQIIEIKDTTGPTFTCPTGLTAVMDGDNCTGSINLPPVSAWDDCSEPVTVFITYGPYTLNSNGGFINNLGAGVSTITYHAVDECGNETTCSVDVDIVDNIVPTVVCDNHTNITLTNLGTAYVPAITFDDGSSDNCCLDYFEVKIMGEPDSSFGPYVEFDCDDIGGDVMVVLRVWDCAGNFNTCMVSVTVEDKTAPEIVCPSNVTINCGSNMNDLNQYGIATATDNCSDFDLNYTFTSNIDNCGEGVIVRTWTATDAGGYTATCSQTITVSNTEPWNANNDQIIWPQDYVTHECAPASLEPEDLPAPYNEPQILGEGICSLVALNHTDFVLTVSGEACYKIMRTWQIMDWCNDNAIYQHVQILEVIDNTDPEFVTLPVDFTVGIISNDCLGTVNLPQVEATDCSESVYVTTSSVLGNGFGPFYNVVAGTYDILYKAIDGCGNLTTHTITVTVEDTKKPTPYCLGEITLVLMQSGMIDIWASDFDLGSYDNCGDVQVSFSTDVNNTQHIFTCDDVGVNELQMWVTDESGNQEYCTVTVNIQDNSTVCPEPGDLVVVGGQVITAYDDYMSSVEVTINSNLGSGQTNETGDYLLEDLPSGGDFTIVPTFDVDYRNGVNTYDLLKMGQHVLETDILDTPYKIIAADVNRSGTISGADVIILKQLVLFNIDELPDNTSWRFITEDYNFVDPLQPLDEDFPESVTYNNVTTDMLGIDFVGIKVGDVSGDAIPQLAGPSNEEAQIFGRNKMSLVLNAVNKGNKYLDVEVSIDNDLDIAGLQMALKYDERLLNLSLIQPVNSFGISLEDINERTMGEPIISLSYIPLSNKQYKSGNMMTLRFDILGELENLNDVFVLEDKFLSAEVYNQDLEIIDLDLDVQYNGGFVVADTDFTCSVAPNPFNESTVLTLKNNKTESGSIQIFDLTGKIIYQRAIELTNGVQQIELNNDFALIDGVYMMRVNTENKSIVEKLIVSKR